MRCSNKDKCKVHAFHYLRKYIIEREFASLTHHFRFHIFLLHFLVCVLYISSLEHARLVDRLELRAQNSFADI